MVKIFLVWIAFMLVVATNAFSEDGKTLIDSRLAKIVEQTIGKVTIIRMDAPEDAPLSVETGTGVDRIRIWREPILFYVTEDRKFIFAGSIFGEPGDNLKKKEVGDTIPKLC